LPKPKLPRDRSEQCKHCGVLDVVSDELERFSGERLRLVDPAEQRAAACGLEQTGHQRMRILDLSSQLEGSVAVVKSALPIASSESELGPNLPRHGF
jgi:hypothetical protein